MDYSAYIQNNPGLLQAFSGLRPQDMKYLTNQGYDLDGNGSISQPEYGQFHWQTYGQNEQRPYTPSGPATSQGGNSGIPYGSNTKLINPNMAPPANYWEGDKFVIGAPGLQAGSQPAPAPGMKTPQPVASSPMPASFAGGGMAGPAPAAAPNASMGGSAQNASQMAAQIGKQLMPQFDMKGMGGNPFLSGLMNRNQTMRA